MKLEDKKIPLGRVFLFSGVNSKLAVSFRVPVPSHKLTYPMEDENHLLRLPWKMGYVSSLFRVTTVTTIYLSISSLPQRYNKSMTLNLVVGFFSARCLVVGISAVAETLFPQGFKTSVIAKLFTWISKSWGRWSIEKNTNVWTLKRVVFLNIKSLRNITI